MRKSIHSPDYKLMIQMLREAREAKNISQETVGAAFGITASQLSKWERLERRVDASEVRIYCNVIGISFIDFMITWDRKAEKP